MKKALKILLAIILSFVVIIIGFVIYCITLTSGVKIDEKKLVNVDKSITYLYSNGEVIKEESGGIEVTDIKDIPQHVQKAFISIEDKRFYSHKGIDVKGLIRATAKNVFSFSLKEGASTISQQLIKNTHLSNEKTLKRKVSEIKLAIELERKFSKDEILEKYLNTIYFGNGKYGITEASKFYFSKPPKDLTVNEGAILASIIKAPSTYSPLSKKDNCILRKNLILKEMYNQDYITHNQYEKSKQNTCEINVCNKESSFMDLVEKECNFLLGDTPYYNQKLCVETTINPKIQEELQNVNFPTQYKHSAIVLNKDNQIEGYLSSSNLENRQVGSTIKPLLVYAPALENDVVYPSTKILDEKQDFNGYTPSNYGNKYYGYVSVKEAVEKSLNIPSVKILNDMGVNKAREYLKKMNFPLTEKDNSLALALGATEKGASLLQLTSCYTTFINEGYYKSSSVIKKITCGNSTILENDANKTKVFSEDTVTLMNDILLSTAKIGTARKLSTLSFPIYSKTGTVGCAKGNTDAYSISYTSDKVLGVWIGNQKDEYLPNNVTGGSLPTEKAMEIWNMIYKNNKKPLEIEKSKGVIEEYIDKISYDNENVVILADDYAPMRYKIKMLFKSNNIPRNKSTRYSNPKLENYSISLDSDLIRINFNVNEGIDVKIYRDDGKEKIVVYDSKGNKKESFCDYTVKQNTEYRYSILPYFSSGKEIFYGEEVFLSKIKTPPLIIGGDDWWISDEDLD